MDSTECHIDFGNPNGLVLLLMGGLATIYTDTVRPISKSDTDKMYHISRPTFFNTVFHILAEQFCTAQHLF